MNIAIGQVIKKHRQEKGITQEQLANHFGVTFQAVSKWENGTTFPDITLLPELAIFFGVTIDDLFSISNEDHVKRIDNLLNNEYIISPENFVYAERVLDKMLEENPKDNAAHMRKCRLYLHRANRDTLAAGRLAEKGLEAAPFDKDLHGIYLNIRRQRQEYDKLVCFYEEYVHKYTEWLQGYFYLIEGYIQEGRLEQAKQTIEKAKSVQKDARLSLFEGDVFLLESEKEKAVFIWQTAVEDNGQDPAVLFGAAERLAKVELYDMAIQLWNKAYDIPPHYADSLYSMAFLYDRLGRYEDAIREWERIIYALKTYWNVSEGETLDWPRREISNLKRKLSNK